MFFQSLAKHTHVHRHVQEYMHVHLRFFFSWRTVNRVGVPSSVRDSQQPFLVLDGAVRMHRLAPTSFRSAGHAFFHQRMEGWDLGGVFIHKDRQIRAKERYGGLVNIQSLTVRGNVAWGLLWAIARVSHAEAHQYRTQGQNPFFFNSTDQMWPDWSFEVLEVSSMTVKIRVHSFMFSPQLSADTDTHTHTLRKSNPSLLRATFILYLVCRDVSRPACHILSQITATECP